MASSPLAALSPPQGGNGGGFLPGFSFVGGASASSPCPRRVHVSRLQIAFKGIFGAGRGWGRSTGEVGLDDNPSAPVGHAARPFAACARGGGHAACSVSRRVVETLPDAHWGPSGNRPACGPAPYLSRPSAAGVSGCTAAQNAHCTMASSPGPQSRQTSSSTCPRFYYDAGPIQMPTPFFMEANL